MSSDDSEAARKKFTAGDLDKTRELQRLKVDRLKTVFADDISGPMEAVDAKIAAAEARTDTKFAELRGDMSREFAEIKTSLSHTPSTLTIWGATFTSAIAIISVILAVMAFGGDRFDAGMGLADVRQNQADRDAKQDDSVRRMEQKLDQLLAAQGKKPTQP